MKVRVSLQQSPNSKFVDVARIIAKGSPPKWLVLGLTQFSGGIGVAISNEDRRRDCATRSLIASATEDPVRK
jgi:hypothetical protein